MDTNIHLCFVGADARPSNNGLTKTLGLEERLKPSRAFASILKSYTAYVIYKVCTVLELVREGREAAEGNRASLVVDVHLSLIHISEPTRLGMISYAVFCLK